MPISSKKLSVADFELLIDKMTSRLDHGILEICHMHAKPS